MKDFYSGKRILVTGGTGSIGSALVRELLAFNPAVIRVFAIHEADEFRMQQDLLGHKNVRYLIGDVRDKDRLRMAMRDIDTVFHAAALKHVSICEYNPFEAVQTNVLGTQNVIQAAVDAGVERMITISTDKAVNPTSTMGATKLLAERIAIAADFFTPGITLAACRFGNVIASRGSLIPLVIDQIVAGGPVTLTNERMTRFFMTIADAAKLVLKAGMRMKGGEIFVLKMPAMKIKDLLEVLIETIAPTVGRDPESIEIKVIGKHWGESFDQGLLTSIEAEHTYETEDMYIALPEYNKSFSTKVYDVMGTTSPYKGGAVTSGNVKLLGKDEIRELLGNSGILPEE
ncbi:MAG: NAD-dependent epimerase/dehydratase family protein [Planctomycetota bacterium]|nr:MAG: NAD-dependent epimerase/dehydratase family protein [Planctomycetota bacterium]